MSATSSTCPGDTRGNLLIGAMRAPLHSRDLRDFAPMHKYVLLPSTTLSSHTGMRIASCSSKFQGRKPQDPTTLAAYGRIPVQHRSAALHVECGIVLHELYTGCPHIPVMLNLQSGELRVSTVVIQPLWFAHTVMLIPKVASEPIPSKSEGNARAKYRGPECHFVYWS